MSTTSRLKVGDRVRFVCNDSLRGITSGMVGVIVEVDSPSALYQVRVGYRSFWLDRGDIEPVAEVGANASKVREWQVPAEPTDCKRVIATDGTDEVYTHNPYSVVVPWVQASSGRPCTWSEVLDAHAGVREYVQTDYEAAVEYFREHPKSLLASSTSLGHARAIIAHVIGEK